VALYIVIVILIVVALLAVLLAKSGIVTIPFVSSHLYTGPAVTRTVQAEDTSLDELIDGIGRKLTAAVQASPKPPYRVKITESELTGALRGSLSELPNNLCVTVEQAQAVVTPKDIEISGIAKKNGLSFDILARYTPVVRGNRLSFEPVQFQVGDFSFATSTVQSIHTYLFTRDIGEWQLEVGNKALSSVELGEGSLNLVFVPK
jgi:hypothetical protein